MEEKIINIVAQHFPEYKKAIQPSTSFSKDLKASLIDKVAVVVDIEEIANVIIAETEKEFEALDTVQDIINTVHSIREEIYGKQSY